MPHTVGTSTTTTTTTATSTATATALVVALVLGLAGSTAPPSAPSARPHDAPTRADTDDAPSTGGARTAPGAHGSRAGTRSPSRLPAPERSAPRGEVLAVPGGYATVARAGDGEHVGLSLGLSPDGERWEWSPLPVQDTDRPVLRLDGPDLVVLAGRAGGTPVRTVTDVEAVLRASPSPLGPTPPVAPTPPGPGGGLRQRPV
jgi:hypothetical protein